MHLALELQDDADWPPKPSTVTCASDPQSRVSNPLWHPTSEPPHRLNLRPPRSLNADSASPEMRRVLGWRKPAWHQRPNPQASWSRGLHCTKWLTLWTAHTLSSLLVLFTSQQNCCVTMLKLEPEASITGIANKRHNALVCWELDERIDTRYWSNHESSRCLQLHWQLNGDD